MSTHQDQYYVPHGSPWPIVGSVGLFLLAGGASVGLNGVAAGNFAAILGAAILIFMLFGWFGTVIREHLKGFFNQQVDQSFRMGMFWFIISEVAFFAAFFGALYYARQLAVPWLAGEGNGLFTNLLLWESYELAWPTNGPAAEGGDFTVMGWKGLPLINTVLLLTSSVTITIAHHALIAKKRTQLNVFLALTFILGFTFLFFQVEEYIHAYRDLNLTLETGIYGATFFLLTGFHGAHVTLGSIMLVIIWLRTMKGHFSPDNHFGFEAVAWYWHFVDVVWLFLFIFVYIL